MGNTKKKTSGKDLGMKIFLIAVIAIVVLALGANLLSSSGLLLHTFNPVTSENFTINGAMMNYFYKTTYYNFVRQMGNSLSYFGLDTSIPLKNQDYVDGTQTWHDYFLSSTTQQAKELLVLAEAAKAAGLELTEEEIAAIDESIASLEETAASYNYPTAASFIAAQYGPGVKVKDIRAAMQLSTLAGKYSAKISDEITITDDEINTYFEENRETYTMVDLRQFTFAASEVELAEATDEEKEEIKASLKAKADALAACKSVDEYEAYLTEYMKGAVVDGIEVTEQNIADNIESTKYTGYTSRDTDQGKWAFEEGRKVGDTFIAENESTLAYTVYMIERTEYRDETTARNVRHILFLSEQHTDAEGAKAKAEEILAEYEAGEKTEDAFAALANKYSEDTGSNTNGGLYENVSVGDMVEEFDAWLFDDARQVGDVEIVETADYGAHIMYYVGEGEPEWKLSVESALTGEKYTAAYEAVAATIEVAQNDFALKLVG